MTVTQAASARVLTIPNVLSVLRLSSVPVFLWFWFADRYETAVVIYAIGATTDFFDGYIARHTGQISELGKILDPLADRVFIVALAVALVGSGALPWAFAGAIVARDVLVVALYPFFQRGGMPKIEVNFTGKCATAALLFGLTCLALSETSFVGAGIGDEVGIVFVGLGAVLYWAAGIMYGKTAMRRSDGGAVST